jgi:hypothetical protein
VTRRDQPPRHSCRFTVDSGRKTICPYGCGEEVVLMECANPACTSTAPGFCMCQMPDY